ncbi:MAG: rRNA ((1402)-N(4))-methyltransferase RsmH [Verrucomicrobiota bacterium]|jgi:16S rRNA (cytosine1402-N4)-methyltransferase
MWLTSSATITEAACASIGEVRGLRSVGALKKFPATQNSVPGTARGFVKATDDRAAPGWLAARRPGTFMDGRTQAPGTERSASVNAMVRAASGWLSARLSWLSESREVSTKLAQATTQASGILMSEVDASNDVPSEAGYHLPVLPSEVAEWMDAKAGDFIIDGTLGGGGHSEMFLKAGAEVLGVDRDPEALAHARARLAGYGSRFSTWQGNFSNLLEIPAIKAGRKADGLLLDLGVSSRQLDSAVRGFSFMREGPLDMRMGPSSERTAADLVNQSSESELARILFEFGEEPKARRIAAALVKQRDLKPFSTTTELASCIEAAVGRQGRIHPATRAFQAIRMAVNEELESLAAALAAVPHVLKPGGKLLVITFHSLEDRMVKRFLRHHSTPMIDDPAWPEPRPNPDLQFELLARKAIAPGAFEISANPRSRSSKLRVARLLKTKP